MNHPEVSNQPTRLSGDFGEGNMSGPLQAAAVGEGS
jgi:hypothetical protein